MCFHKQKPKPVSSRSYAAACRIATVYFLGGRDEVRKGFRVWFATQLVLAKETLPPSYVMRGATAELHQITAMFALIIIHVYYSQKGLLYTAMGYKHVDEPINDLQPSDDVLVTEAASLDRYLF